MRFLVLFVLVIIEVVYIVVGGFIFWAIESHQKQSQTFNLSSLISNFTSSYKCPNDSDENLLNNFINQLLDAERNGLLIDESTLTTNKWDIPSSIFFAMTIVTTIGYGNQTPSTSGGQIFCCFYAIIGIPLTLVMLVGIGELLNKVSKKLQFKIFKETSRKNRVLQTATMIFLGLVLFIVIPAGIFTAIEGWGYGTSIYYAIITLTTVGFGDYVAGVTTYGRVRWFYRVSVGIWIFLGLAWLTGLIGSIQEEFQSVVTKADENPIIKRKDKKKSSEEEKISREDPEVEVTELVEKIKTDASEVKAKDSIGSEVYDETSGSKVKEDNITMTISDSKPDNEISYIESERL